MARRPAVARTALSAAVVAAVLGVGAWVVTPLWVAFSLERWAGSAPGREAAVERIRVNPFLLRLTLEGGRVVAPEQGVAGTFERIVLDYAARSLVSTSREFDAIEIERPDIVLATPVTLPEESEVRHVGRVVVRNGALSLSSGEPRAAAGGALEAGGTAGLRVIALTLEVESVDAESATPGPFRLEATGAEGGRLVAEGGVRVMPWSVEGRMSFDGAPVAFASALLGPGVALESPLRVESGFALDAAAGFSLHDSRFEAAAASVVRGAAVELPADRVDFAVATLHLPGSGASGAGWRLDDVAGRVERLAGDAGIAGDAGDAGIAGDAGGAGDGGHAGDAAAEIVWRIEGGLGGGEAVLQGRAAADAPLQARSARVELADVAVASFADAWQAVFGTPPGSGRVDARVDLESGSGALNGEVQLTAYELEWIPPGAESPAGGPAPEAGGPAVPPLALAVLEDPDGRARLALHFTAPSGRGAVPTVLEALDEHFAELAAEPFEALARSLRGDAPRPVLPFRPGEAQLDETGAAALDTLAAALMQRPRLGVVVRGRADAEIDRRALAVAQIELHVTLATAGPTLVARPQPVDFAAPRHQDVLEEFAVERLGAARRNAIAAGYPTDDDGRVVADQRAGFYRALFEALVAHEPIPGSALERLARFRGQAVAMALTASGLDAGRIVTAPPVVVETPRSAEAERNVGEEHDVDAQLSDEQVVHAGIELVHRAAVEPAQPPVETSPIRPPDSLDEPGTITEPESLDEPQAIISESVLQPRG